MSESSCPAYEHRGLVAILRLDNPPVNGLSCELRRSFLSALDAAEADCEVAAILVIGSEEVFSCGADIKEFGTPMAVREPNLPTLVEALEGCRKPTIAAIGGKCMGGGLELALGCHYRVALIDAQLSLPEIKLGLIPGAGGTQRLPRLVGVEASLDLILSGSLVSVEKFRNTNLIDQFIENDLISGAFAFAEHLLAQRLGPRQVGERKVPALDHEAVLQFARSLTKPGSATFVASQKAVDAVDGSRTLSIRRGLELEQTLFWQLMDTPESRALRHVFTAERACAKVPGIDKDTPVRSVTSVGVIGAGTMGIGISMCFLQAGIPVTWLEVNPETLEKGLAAIRKNFGDQVAKGRLSPQVMEERFSMLKPTFEYSDICDADLIVEAVFEDIEVKKDVFCRLDDVAKPGAILASNTSSIDLNKIAAFTRRPEDVIGLHFFSPANIMQLLEVVRGTSTAVEVLATAMQLAKRIRKLAVVSRVCDGFIGNRMLAPYLRMAEVLLLDGATPERVDRALEKWGMAMGPFRMADMAGNDIGWAVRKRQYKELPAMPRSVIADRLCEKGRFGQKTGFGWYRYVPGRRDPVPDAEVEQMIVDCRAEMGLSPRRISDDEIVERCIFALVNEGAHVLEEGIALRASDIDMVYLTGYGFPRHRGGPMHYADEVGLYRVARRMRRFADAGDSQFGQPAPLLARLAEHGGSFGAGEQP